MFWIWTKQLKLLLTLKLMFVFQSPVFICLPLLLKHSYVLGCTNAKTEPFTVRQEAEDGSQNPADTQRCPWHFQTPGPDMETSVKGNAGFKSAIGSSWSVSNHHSFGKKYFLNEFKWIFIFFGCLQLFAFHRHKFKFDVKTLDKMDLYVWIYMYAPVFHKMS